MFGPASKATSTALTRAAEEAARRGDRRLGTEHLFLGLLHDDAVAQSMGTDLTSARVTAAQLDQIALTAIGVNLTPITEAAHPRAASRIPLTSGAREALAHAVASAQREKARKVEPHHLLNALYERTRPDPVAELIHALRLRGPDER